MTGTDTDLDRWVGLAAGLVGLPTAPLFEHLPAARVRAFADERASLRRWGDAVGNTVVASGEGDPALVLVAHLDHPAFAIDPDGHLCFRGGVREGHARPGDAVLFHRLGEVEPTGRGRLVDVEVDTERGRLTGARVDVTEGEAPAGGFAVWDLPAWSVEDGRITARACDDLMGAAAILAVLDDLDRSGGGPAAVWGLFTRGEEIGLLGAFEAIRLATVPTSAPVLSLECSKALANAPQGGGAIVRVGDAASVFDPGLSAAVWSAVRETGVTAQRRLMDGGTCEATAFCAAGYRASGLALPLAGYHNQADDGLGIVAESVLVTDFQAEVEILRALASDPGALASASPPAWVADGAARAADSFSTAEPIP